MSDSILDPAIFGETGYGEDAPANAEVIARPGKKRPRKQGKAAAGTTAAGDASAASAKPMSKSQAKKLAKIAEAKAKAERRSTVMASLAKTAASAEQLAVLRKSGALGQKSSLKADLKHTLSLQRLGVDAKHDKLLVEQPAKPATDSDVSDSDGALPHSAPARAPSTAFAVQMPPSAGSARAAGHSAPHSPGSGAGFRVSLSDVSFAGPLAIPDVLRSQQSRGAGASIDEQRGAEAALAALRAKNAALAMAGQFAVDAAWTPDQKRRAQSQPVKSTLDVDHSSDDSSSVDSDEAEPAAAPAPSAPRIVPVIPPMVHSKFVVKVARPHAIAKSRQALPVVSMEQEIMEAITHHDVVIIAGETGSGKTTQVPQFLYEAGYGHPDGTPGLIGVTQPRRVATTAMAERVAAELATPVGARGHVGWQVRYDASHVSDATRVKFLTDGILLREAQSDLLLSKYSAIIIDEAHERNLNTDVLLGLLSRAVPLRAELAGTAAYPNLRRLKLIIMSATLRVSDFTENAALFPAPPPVINVRARQFPVSLHFAKRTELRDYVGEAFKKVTQIHARLPAGGILVFLTGQAEIEDLCARLTTYYSKKERAKRRQAALEEAAAAAESAAEDSDDSDASSHRSASSAASSITSSDAGSQRSEQPKPPARTRTLLQREPGLQPADAYDSDSASSAASLSDADEPDVGIRKAGEGMDDVGPVSVLPLYAMLPRAAQRRVFEAPPPGHRAIVVSTNVAETSVTIPGMRYVMIARGPALFRDMKLSLCRLALRLRALHEGGSCRYAE